MTSHQLPPVYPTPATNYAYAPNGYIPHDRSLTRTPSPTPSEQRALSNDKMSDWKIVSKRQRILTTLFMVVMIVAFSLFMHYETKIVHALKPAADWIRDLPAGWLIPIAVLIILSFPPLFGHEIVAVLCGIVWGYGAGFGIVAAGTLLGELANFYAFRYLFTRRANRIEQKTLSYACFARVVRDGGFKIALITRYSAIPGHFTTAVYSTAGMGVGIFIAAAVLSLPKLFAVVVVGVLADKTGSNGKETKDARIASIAVVVVTGLITVVALKYIQRLIHSVKGQVIYERRKARQNPKEFDVEQAGGLAAPRAVYAHN